MNEPGGVVLPTTPARTARTLIGPLISALVCLFILAAFLPTQELWIDEVASLDGLRLNPIKVLGWLKIDRNPPLYYWTGWLWSQAFGLTAPSLRWFAVALTCLTSAVVFVTARRISGELAGWVAGLAFAACPNTALAGVEIRTYALFMFVSALAWHGYVSILGEPDRRSGSRWLTFGAALVLASYTHIFGLVLSGALLFTLALSELRHRRSINPILWLGLLIFLVTLTLIPLVAGAQVGVATSGLHLREILRLLFRLIGHGAMMLWRPALAATLLGAVVLAALAVTSVSGRVVGRTMGTAIVFGLAASLVAQLLLTGFDATDSKYATWARPASFVVLGGGVAISSGWRSWMAKLAAATFVFGQLAGAAELVRYGNYFGQGQDRPILRILTEETVPTAIVYDSSPDKWWIYRPLAFELPTNVPQFQLEPNEGMTSVKLLKPDGEWQSTLASFDRLAVIRARLEDTDVVVQQIRTGPQPFSPGQVPQRLESTGLWQPVTKRLFVGLLTAEVVVLRRIARGNAH